MDAAPSIYSRKGLLIASFQPVTAGRTLGTPGRVRRVLAYPGAY